VNDREIKQKPKETRSQIREESIAEAVPCIIKGGNVVFSEGVAESDLLIEEGIIKCIGKELEVRSRDTVIDASGKYVLPGLIDAHVHPQYEDNFQDLSEAAAFGGITTLIHYVYVREGTDLIEKIEESVNEGKKNSHLDFALHASLQDAESQMLQIKEAIARGVTSFKMFMAFAKRGMSVSDKLLIAVMDRIGRLGGMSMVHAEDVACEYLEEQFIAEGKISPAFYPQSRPNQFEADAVSRAIIFANTVNCPLYLVHLSARESLEPVRNARAAGQVVYAETCPHYLTLTDDIFERLGSLAKCAPPIRKAADVEAMWGAIRNHLVDVVASDHSGQKMEKRQSNNVFDAPFGIPGTETMFYLLHEEGVNRKRIGLPMLVKVLSENPAKIFGLYPKKGALRVGSDADLVILDPGESHVIGAKTLHGKSDFTLHEGWKCNGKPVLTMQRGKIVLKDGVLNSKPGDGTFLPRKVSKGQTLL
jgi:dihydropyrimidinase